MQEFVQKGLLVSYRCFRRSGLGEHPIGRAIFESCYEFYKLRFEGRAINALRVYVESGTCAIDVGANIGVITLRLAEWVGSQGKVIAIEPETTNVARLRQRMTKHGMTARVDVHQAAAAESSGTVRLALNPDHPGDHRLAANGVSIPAVTIDELIGASPLPTVSLIKIDVQGAETRVLKGALETIRRHQPAIFVEIDDAALREQGSSAEELVAWLRANAYEPHRIEGEGKMTRLQPDDALKSAKGRPYSDFLFLPPILRDE